MLLAMAFSSAAKLRRFAHRSAAAAKPIEDRQRALHREVAGLLVVRLRRTRHHEAVQDAWEYMHFDVFHARRYGPIGVQHRRRRAMILVAPDDADRFGDAFKLMNVVAHLRGMTADSCRIAEPLRP